MIVKIVKCKSKAYWYSDRINQTFGAEYYDKYNYRVLKTNFFILKKDCIILKEEKEMTKQEELRKLLGEMTLAEAVEAGISEETYSKLTRMENNLDWLKEEIEYYYINECGEVDFHVYDSEFLIHEHNKLTGNYFKTNEIAENKLADMQDEITQKFIKIENYVRNNYDDGMADWKDLNQCKYYIYYDYSNNTWYTIQSSYNRSNSYHMNKETAKRVVEMLQRGEL